MSSNSNVQLHKRSSQLISSTVPSTVTLASTLSFALAEIDRLKLEAKEMTNRANHAENLLLSLLVKNPPGSVSNTMANSNNPKAASSPAALNALAALMSAESRTRAAESQLATVLSSLSKLLHLDSFETDARRQFENIIVDERRKIVHSTGNETMKTRFVDHPSQPSLSLPLLRTESAPEVLASSSMLPSPCSPVSSQSSYTQNGIPPVYNYPPPTSTQISPHSHQIQNQNTYSQHTLPRHEIRNSYPPQINHFNQPQIPLNSSVNPSFVSASGSHHTTYQQQPQQQPQYHQKPTNVTNINNNVNRHLPTTVDRGSISHHHTRGSESGVPDYHHQQGVHHPSEQICSVKSLDDRSSRLNSNQQLPETETLPQDEAIGVKQGDESHGAVSINDLLCEFSRRGSGKQLEVGIKEQRRESCGELNAAVGTEQTSKVDSVIKSNDADVAISIVTQVRVQSQLGKRHSPISGSPVTVLDNNDKYGSPSSSIGESPRPTSTASNSLTGLRPLSSIPTQDLFKAVEFPPGKYPDTNAQGEKTCRQCGQPGLYKNGKCVEKWSAGPEGPETVSENETVRESDCVDAGIGTKME
ncbi:hypothetical protein Clacol_004967 [Clathrus columnatus]|uniref:Uncharacterized protein n=1 Tax=Clathrus columnatus TaxID=1419009 RepID=A0AAV5A8V6_9AGAM|nr:hypothetical protein Clacol_004967 [Clathrus columnatus]